MREFKQPFTVLCLFLGVFSPLLGQTQNNHRDVAWKLKQQTLAIIEKIEQQGIQEFGLRQPISLDKVKKKITSTTFIPLNSEDFARNSEKSRRSAFYTDSYKENIIYFNRDFVPSPQLLIHEILKDRQYEVSNGIASLYSLIKDETNLAESSYSSSVFYAIKSSVDQLVDRFGLSAQSPHWWEEPKVEAMAMSNAIIRLPAGGDVSGGGGDDGGFLMKSQILLKLLKRLAPLYAQELGFSSHLQLKEKLANIHFLLSVKMFVETDHKLSGKRVEYYFGTDSIERLLFFPYLIVISPDANPVTDAEKAVDVIVQSDLFREIPSLERKYNSKCSCQGKDKAWALPYLCPDPQKTHEALHWLMNFYKTNTEESNSCRMAIGHG